MAPVGVWVIEGDRPESYYPPENERFRERGWNALTAQPGLPLEEWARFKASSSPAWRLHDDIATVALIATVGVEYVLRAIFVSERDAREAKGHAVELMASQVRDEPTVHDGGAHQNVLAASWHIASVLTRRHPDLVVHEMHPGGGLYDVLMVAEEQDLGLAHAESRPRVMLNRAGSLQVHRGQSEMQKVADWSDVLLRVGVSRVVAEIEAAADWAQPFSVPTATARGLAYRFISTALHMLGGERHLWDARSEHIDSSGVEASRHHHVDAFPSVLEEDEKARRLATASTPYSRLWVLLRDEEPVAVVTTAGRLHRRSQAPVDLLAAYGKHGARTRRMTAALMNRWL